ELRKGTNAPRRRSRQDRQLGGCPGRMATSWCQAADPEEDPGKAIVPSRCGMGLVEILRAEGHGIARALYHSVSEPYSWTAETADCGVEGALRDAAPRTQGRTNQAATRQD